MSYGWLEGGFFSPQRMEKWKEGHICNENVSVQAGIDDTKTLLQAPFNKYTMRSLLTAAFLFISFGAFAQSSKEAEVWKKVEALHKAVFETKDSMAMKELVSEDVTYGHSGGNIEDKAAMVHNAAVSKNQYKNPVFERQSISVSKKAAVIRHTFRAITVDGKGAENPLDLGILQVWKKENGKWKLWARQAVKIAPKN